MKKRSLVINLKGIIRKTAYTLTAISLIGFAASLGVPQYIFEKLALAVFAKENDFEIEEIFSLDGKKVITDMMLYKVKEKEVIPKEVPKKEEIITPDTPAVDISKAKSSSSVEEKNIIITNTPKKQFNISELLRKPLNYTKTDGYKVLIIHTHTTESYLPNDRSENQAENIVRIGEEFHRVLTENNIKTLHCKTVHDAPYSKSYINELASIQKILKEHPSIEVIIDVHRDGLYNSKNEKLRPITNINGEDTAQVMLV